MDNVVVDNDIDALDTNKSVMMMMMLLLLMMIPSTNNIPQPDERSMTMTIFLV